MPNKILWSAGSPVTLLTTELNAIVHGGLLTSAIVDAVNEQFISLKLTLSATVSAKASGAYFALYLLPELDDIYPLSAPTTLPLSAYLKPVFNFHNLVDAESSIVTNIFLPFSKFKIAIINNIGQTTHTSGNTLQYKLGSSEVQ